MRKTFIFMLLVQPLLAESSYEINWDEAKTRPVCIESHLNGRLLKKDILVWEEENSKTPAAHLVENEKGEVVSYHKIKRDKQGRLLEVTLYGNLTGRGKPVIALDDKQQVADPEVEKYTVAYRYEGERLAEICEDNGKNILYLYDPLLNKLDAKLVREGERIIHRTFYLYDTEGNCIEEILDNGCMPSRTDLTSVTWQHTMKNKTLGQEIDQIDFVDSSPGNDLPPLDATLLLRAEKGGSLVQEDLYDPEGLCKRSKLLDYENGKQISLLDSEGIFEERTLDDRGCLLSLNTTFSGGIETTIFDTEGRLLQKDVLLDTGERSRRTRAYNEDGQCVSITDECGNKTLFEYDSLKRLIKITYPEVEGQIFTEEMAYDLNHCEVARKDMNGYVTHSEYNTRKQLTKRLYPDGRKEEFFYDLSGKLQNSTPILSLETKSSLSLTQQEEKPLHTEYFYGKTGVTVGEVFKNGTTQIKSYDALGRIRSLVTRGLFGTILLTEEFACDGNGNIIERKRTDSLGKSVITRAKYGPMNRLEEIIEDPDTPHEKVTSYEYTSSGKLDTIRKPNGISLIYEYDESERISSFLASDASFAYRFTYDEADRIIGIQDLIKQTQTLREYSKEGYLLKEVLGNGLFLENTYDEKGRRNKIVFPDGSEIRYHYEGELLSFVQRVQNEGAVSYTHSYKSYSPEGHLLLSEMIGEAGEISYGWKNGKACLLTSPYLSEVNLDTPTEKTLHHDLFDAFENVYAYDELGQLIEEEGMFQKKYPFNAHGESLEREGFLFDLQGNLVEKREGGTLKKYHYDALDRLIQVETPGKECITHTYDAFSRRLQTERTSFEADTKETIYYLYDHYNEIGAFASLDHPIELRVLGLGYGAEIGAAVALEIGGKVYAPVHDLRGNVACLVDIENKKAIETIRYAAFGEKVILNEQGQIKKNSLTSWHLAGKRSESNDDLIFFGKRYYSPTLCCFVSKDPLYDFDHPNPYVYARNSPLIRTDLYGLFSLPSTLGELWTVIGNAIETVPGQIKRLPSIYYQEIGKIYRYRDSLETMAKEIFGPTFFILTGTVSSGATQGVIGLGEIGDEVRVTYINGILNANSDCKEMAGQISKIHGNVNVHYALKTTEGWCWDLLKAAMIKMGYIPPEAIELATMWKSLIEETGGIEGHGKIIHYAHSLGGTITNTAGLLLSPEELSKITVCSLGSATMISPSSFGKVTNYVSRRDGVCLTDPMGYYSGALNPHGSNVVFVGSLGQGFPFIDHLLTNETYWSIIDSLGKEFIEEFGAVKTLEN